MGREIKFRAWHKTKQKYYSIVSLNFYAKNVCIGKPYVNIWVSFDDVILEQYTGLKDKNGVEVYVGDIVEFEYEDFDCNGDNGIIDKERLVVGSPFDIDWLYHSDDYIVIRNIHENKELLK